MELVSLPEKIDDQQFFICFLTNPLKSSTLFSNFFNVAYHIPVISFFFLHLSVEECGRYLETVKVYENKPADIIQGHMDSDYLSRVCAI